MAQGFFFVYWKLGVFLFAFSARSVNRLNAIWQRRCWGLSLDDLFSLQMLFLRNLCFFFLFFITFLFCQKFFVRFFCDFRGRFGNNGFEFWWGLGGRTVDLERKVLIIVNIVNDLSVNFGLRIGVQVIDVLYNFVIFCFWFWNWFLLIPIFSLRYNCCTFLGRSLIGWRNHVEKKWIYVRLGFGVRVGRCCI